MKDDRQLTAIDRLIAGVDGALRAVNTKSNREERPNPAAGVKETSLTDAEKQHSAGLMRVNHTGEIAAQGLYQGHAAVARDPAIQNHMIEAADEERDHLAWCEDRLLQLGSGPSKLRPVWYVGSFAIGAASGALGDKWSLGFIEETEHQVSEHLSKHLVKLPQNDAKSRAIVSRMREEEEAHGARANEAGAAELPQPVKTLMRVIAKIMTAVSYRI